MKNRKAWLLAGIWNILVLTILVINIMNVYQNDIDIVMNKIPLYSNEGPIETNNLFQADYAASTYWFEGRVDSLKPGVYSVKVSYKTNYDSAYFNCYSSTDGSVYPAIYVDGYSLVSSREYLTFTMWVNSGIDTLRVRINCGDVNAISTDSTLFIDRIEVSRECGKTITYWMLKICVILMLFDGLFVLFLNRRAIKENIYVIVGLTSIFVVCSLTVMSNYQNWGHDMLFHWERIVGLAEGLRTGSFPVKIQPGWINGYGYAVSVFYGDALLYVAALLYLLGVPIIYAYKCYLLLVNMGTLFIAYYCFKRLSNDKYIGVTCTALYCLSINRIMNVYLRCAVGEYTAYMFHPLVLLGIKEILAVDEKKSSDKKGWIFLCLGMTGIIQTHVLSFEMVCLSIAIILVITFKRFLQRDKLGIFLKGVTVTIFLNLNFILPFLDYSREELKVFDEKESYGIQWWGLSLYELFSFGTTGLGEMKQSTAGLKGRIPVSLGLAMICVILLMMILLAKYEWRRDEKNQLLLVAGFAGIILFMSTYHFPWNILADKPVIRNVVSSIQFPWRFVSIALPVLTYMAALVFVKLKTVTSKRKLYQILVGICLISAAQGMYYVDLIVRDSENFIRYDGTDFSYNAAAVSGGEYLLNGSDVNLALGEGDVLGENVVILDVEKYGNKMEVSCQAEGEAYLELPLFQYDYYECVDIKSEEKFPITRGKNNKICVDLPTGYQGTLRINFVEPWYWRAAEGVSVVSWLIFLLYIWKRRQKQFELLISVC